MSVEYHDSGPFPNLPYRNLDSDEYRDSSPSNSPSDSPLDDDMDYDYDLSATGVPSQDSPFPDLQLSRPSASGLKSSSQTFTRKSKAGKRHFVTPAGASAELICTFTDDGGHPCSEKFLLPSKLR